MCIRDSVCAGTDGHAQIGFGKGRSVVYAVADHGDFMACRLEGGNVFFFILRQDTGNDLRNVETLANAVSDTHLQSLFPYRQSVRGHTIARRP